MGALNFKNFSRLKQDTDYFLIKDLKIDPIYLIFTDNSLEDIIKLYKKLKKKDTFFMEKYDFCLFYKTHFSNIIFKTYSKDLGKIKRSH